MSYDLPTAADLKAKLPLFAAVSDPVITAALGEAASQVDQTWREADYKPAIIYLAAHIMSVDGVLLNANAPGGAGQMIASGEISEMKVGDVMVKVGGGGQSSGAIATSQGYGSTRYGQRFLQLMRLNHPAIAIV